MSSTDCRTRNNAFSLKNSSARKSSNGTTYGPNEGNLDSSPARIFEHCRLPQSEVEDDLNQTTEIKFPSTFEEVEQWMDDLVESALRATGDEPHQSSSIKILFLDEKRCAKVLGEEFPMNRLQPKLKILDWCTSHYMSTFCRFPLPLDLDGDDDVHHVWDWRFTISHPFDWDMLWVYFPTTRTSLGIVRTWFDGYDTNFTQMENEVTNFVGPTLAHPMLLGLLALQVLTSDSMANVREKGNRIYESQTLTGFHNYNRLRVLDMEDDNPEHDLGVVTRRVIGAASNMTGWENASLQLIKFAGFIQDQNKRYQGSRFGPNDRSEKRLCTYVDEQAQKLIGDLDGAYHDSLAWLATAQFLLQGVLNVLGQKDAFVNIELGKDQKRIAEETKRDSTSMTGIAVVTMFFLPGTFTASFFALPFFESDIKDRGLHEFWIYWVVTVPLTVITLTVWTIWTRYMNPPIQSAKAVKFQEQKEAEDPEKKPISLIQEFLVRTRTRSLGGQVPQRPPLGR